MGKGDFDYRKHVRSTIYCGMGKGTGNGGKDAPAVEEEAVNKEEEEEEPGLTPEQVDEIFVRRFEARAAEEEAVNKDEEEEEPGLATDLAMEDEEEEANWER